MPLRNPRFAHYFFRKSFVEESPLIDGILDENLKDVLPKREFEYKFNLNLFKGSAGSNYRLAYGTGFIYLCIEAEADSFICRDRGYQNGDGFIFTLTSVLPGGRGISHYYRTEYAQFDIQEVIQNAIDNYSVDTSNHPEG